MALETFSETIGTWSVTKLATYIKALIQESIPTSLTLRNLTVTNEFNIPGGDSSILPGTILAYGGSTAPTGYLLCDGSSLDTTTQASLFAIIGYTYGGSGSSFNVPDLRGRVAVGKGTHTDVDALGENEGAVLGDRRPKHKHSVSASDFTNNFVGGSADCLDRRTDTSATSQGHISVTVGPQTNAPTDTPAYLIINYIIKV